MQRVLNTNAYMAEANAAKSYASGSDSDISLWCKAMCWQDLEQLAEESGVVLSIPLDGFHSVLVHLRSHFWPLRSLGMS